jgi:hypothetical protein
MRSIHYAKSETLIVCGSKVMNAALVFVGDGAKSGPFKAIAMFVDLVIGMNSAIAQSQFCLHSPPVATTETTAV